MRTARGLSEICPFQVSLQLPPGRTETSEGKLSDASRGQRVSGRHHKDLGSGGSHRRLVSRLSSLCDSSTNTLYPVSCVFFFIPPCEAPSRLGTMCDSGIQPSLTHDLQSRVQSQTL